VDEVTSAGSSLFDDAKTNAELYSRYMKKAIEKVGCNTPVVTRHWLWGMCTPPP
jgi:hypothetical protein